jgi:hypothetical protein
MDYCGLLMSTNNRILVALTEQELTEVEKLAKRSPDKAIQRLWEQILGKQPEGGHQASNISDYELSAEQHDRIERAMVLRRRSRSLTNQGAILWLGYGPARGA